MKKGLVAEFITCAKRSHRGRRLHSEDHVGSDSKPTESIGVSTLSYFYEGGGKKRIKGHRLEDDGVTKRTILDYTAEGDGDEDVGIDEPTIFYLHGGGFCFGSVPSYRR